MVKMKYTLVFIKRDNDEEVLLGYKTRGFGAQRWNGFGGKLEPDETIETAAYRELREESNLRAGNLQHIAVNHYIVENSEREDIVHIFTSSTFRGEIIESEEMSPIRWFKSSHVPYNHMWLDSILWFEDMLANKHFSMIVTLNETMSEIVKSEKIYYSDSSNFLQNIKIYT